MQSSCMCSYPFLPKHVKDNLLEFLQSKFNNSLRIRISRADQPVFSRLKIKIKSEIVTMHKDDVHPTECVGLYVKPNKWNDLLEDPDCLVIDTRNDYEIKVGTFRNAVNPHTQSFVEFPQWMSQNLAAREKPPKKVAMFCKWVSKRVTWQREVIYQTSYLLNSCFMFEQVPAVSVVKKQPMQPFDCFRKMFESIIWKGEFWLI